MNDKEIMENLLLTTKGVCDLYLHGSIESATPAVHQAFHSALDSALCMQSGIYQKVSAFCPLRFLYPRPGRQPVLPAAGSG